MIANAETPTWSKCRHPRTAENTKPQKGTPGGRCRCCDRDRQTRWNRANRERVSSWHRAYRERNLKAISAKSVAYNRLRDTGWTPEAFAAADKSQLGLCAICLRERPLQGDHCHARKVTRALLCNRCNLMLGQASDNSDLLRRAAAYVDQWNYS